MQGPRLLQVMSLTKQPAAKLLPNDLAFHTYQSTSASCQSSVRTATAATFLLEQPISCQATAPAQPSCVPNTLGVGVNHSVVLQLQINWNICTGRDCQVPLHQTCPCGPCCTASSGHLSQRGAAYAR